MVFTHTLRASFREGGNIPAIWASQRGGYRRRRHHLVVNPHGVSSRRLTSGPADRYDVVLPSMSRDTLNPPLHSSDPPLRAAQEPVTFAELRPKEVVDLGA